MGTTLQEKYAKFDPPLIIFTLILLAIKGSLLYTCVSQLWGRCICAQDFLKQLCREIHDIRPVIVLFLQKILEVFSKMYFVFTTLHKGGGGVVDLTDVSC
jgi:hypothetical protein